MGAVAKTFGVLLLVLGILLLVGGIAAAAFSASDEQDNQGQLLQDGERSDQNAALLTYGGAGAVLGLILLIVGVVLVAIGPKPSASPAWVAAPPATQPSAPPVPRPRRRAIVAVVAVVAAVALLALAAVAFGGPQGGASSVFGSFGDGPAAQDLGSDVFEGTVAQGASLPLVGSVSGGDNDHDLQAPQGTARLAAVVQWTPRDGGAGALEVIVTLADGTEVARGTGTPGFAIEVADASFDLGARLHYQVFPADSVGAVAEQPFTIETRFLAA